MVGDVGSRRWAPAESQPFNALDSSLLKHISRSVSAAVGDIHGRLGPLLAPFAALPYAYARQDYSLR